jgi:hypothetical protein
LLAVCGRCAYHRCPDCRGVGCATPYLVVAPVGRRGRKLCHIRRLCCHTPLLGTARVLGLVSEPSLNCELSMELALYPRSHRESYTAAERRVLSLQASQEALAEMRRSPGYAPTLLRTLSKLAGSLGLHEILSKDETTRFALGGFKARRKLRRGTRAATPASRCLRYRRCTLGYS